MKALLYKELRLAMHPAAVIFILLSGMLMIPNYPYYVIFFYTTLGLFFVCLSGRENHDIFFSALLPISKREIVAARITLAVLLETAQIAAAIPFAILRQSLPVGGNPVGIDANIAFFGSSLIMLGLSNFVFFTSYYKDPDRVGVSFVKASAVSAVYIGAAETLVHALPFARDVLDTPDPTGLAAKLILLGAGAVLYAVLTWGAFAVSAKRLERVDL